MSLIEVIQSGNYELIDVREPMELEMDGNIDGAKNIPLGEMQQLAASPQRPCGILPSYCQREP